MALAGVGFAGVAGAGCGDPPLCRSEVFVAFQPTVISTDVDALAPGVQTDLDIRTSLLPGDIVTLEVAGADGTPQETLEQPVGADGRVVFTGVSVPAPRVLLRATGRGICGEGRAEIMADVLPGVASCEVQLVPEPEVNPSYAPLGVLSQHSDPDPERPGYQTVVRVLTRPGWTAEVFRITTEETSLGAVVASSSGVVFQPATVFDGQVGFRAVCHGPGATLASRTVTLFADTTSPTCDLIDPMPGVDITPVLDGNHDVTDGLQLAVTAHANGADVAGEPVMLTITGVQGPSPTLPPTPSNTDLLGTSTASVTLPRNTPADYEFVLTMRDHAGNACTTAVTYRVSYDDRGCPITVASPTGPVTHDADASRPGVQADVTLAVGGACTGQVVTSTCGANSPSGLVGQDGRVTLRPDLCATSPCQAMVGCAFQVTDPIGIGTEARATIGLDDQPPVSDFDATPASGKGIRLTWTSPDHGVLGTSVAAYLVKAATVPFTDANFDTTGAVLASSAPAAPGSPEGLDAPRDPGGLTQYFAIATLDGAGHRSAVAVKTVAPSASGDLGATGVARRP